MILAEAIVTLVLIALLAYVLYPIFKGRDELLFTAVNGKEIGSKQAIYGQIYELDFDYQMGKLTEEDYRTLRQQLVLEAAKRLREEKQRGRELEALVDRELARMARGEGRCAQCGSEVPPDARFCHICGSKL